MAQDPCAPGVRARDVTLVEDRVHLARGLAQPRASEVLGEGRAHVLREELGEVARAEARVLGEQVECDALAEALVYVGHRAAQGPVTLDGGGQVDGRLPRGF